jgi:dihydrofolate reductase
MTRTLVAVEFLSLDGVMQAPGDPREDTEGGFVHGGWQRPYFDDVMAAAGAEGMAATDAYLFGRKTYQKMASFWPSAPGDDPFAAHLNGSRKYVASRTLTDPAWGPVEVIADDVPGAVAGLKDRTGGTITVLGSGELVRLLLEHDLVDELELTVSPLVIGSGKRLFGEAPDVRHLELAGSVPTTTGSVMLRYRRARPTAGRTHHG